MKLQNKVVIIATSAPQDRDYRVEFLNAFAYPRGHHVFFRYRAKWIASDIRSDLEQLKSEPSILVFCDASGSDDFTFFPVRHCRIVDVEVSSLGRPLQDDDYVAVRLELEDFVHPEMAANQGFVDLIKSQADRPYPQGSVHQSAGKFLFSRDVSATLRLDANGEWFRTAARLAGAGSLNGAVMMHIRRIVEIRDSGRKDHSPGAPVGAAPGGYGLQYELRHDKTYALDLEYAVDTIDHLAIPEVAPARVSVSMPIRRFFPQYISSRILLTPIGSTDGHCGLLVSPGSVANGQNLNGPRAILMLKIRGSRPRTMLHAIIISGGLFLQTFAVSIERHSVSFFGLTTTRDLTAFTVGFIKLFGIVASTLGVLWGLKQLPNLPS